MFFPALRSPCGLLATNESFLVESFSFYGSFLSVSLILVILLSLQATFEVPVGGLYLSDSDIPL
jgi:hypothetical protein